ncbi:hypothetical protein DRP04_14235 [Archaeoglobales archaeon]|nr:MAG: hypothetical protein DRP04_14235 [Archaeoglobales archaeon]
MELEDVIEKAINFLKMVGHSYPKLYEVRKVGEKWKVRAELGFGIFAIIEIDDETGKVRGFYEEESV